MSLKAQVEALIYAAEEPITLEQLALLLRDAVLAERTAAQERAILALVDTACESTMLPELDSEEFNGLEPGPLMPQELLELELEQEETLSALEEFREGDEPFFALQAEAATGPAVAEAAASAETAPLESAGVAEKQSTARKRQPKKSEAEIAEDKAVRARLREILAELIADYASEECGMEIRQVAGGFRMATKPQHHDLVRAFSKSLKPPTRLSLAALETLAVVAYKQPITAPEIADIRGVESGSVLGTLLDRKLITTAGRKQVIGRPMQYKTSRDFLLRFGLNDLNELPSMEEFSQLAFDSALEVGGTEGAQTPPENTHAAQAEEPEAPSSTEQSTMPSAAGQASANESQSEAEPGDLTEEAEQPRSEDTRGS